jgi:DNA processing protein
VVTIESELEATEKSGAQLVAITSDAYPPYLAETSDAPTFLTVLGELTRLTTPSISIVGARNASMNGKKLPTYWAKSYRKGDLRFSRA